MSFLLDTNVISQPTKPAPDPAIIAWLGATPEFLIFLSVASLIEIRTGVELMPEGKRRAALSSWILNDLPQRFGQRILPVSNEIAFECGYLIAQSRRVALTVEPMDALIAATARVHRLAIVTLNRKHFSHFDVPLVRF